MTNYRNTLKGTNFNNEQNTLQEIFPTFINYKIDTGKGLKNFTKAKINLLTLRRNLRANKISAQGSYIEQLHTAITNDNCPTHVTLQFNLSFQQP